MTPDILTSRELRIRSIAQELSFLSKPNWINYLQTLDPAKNPAREQKRAIIKQALVPVARKNGHSLMGYCMDERPTLIEKSKPKIAFVGGAAGWMVLFIATGLSYHQAVANTEMLYRQMNWGPLEGHIDDEHGHIASPARLEERIEGCGFLSVWTDVLQIMHSILKSNDLLIHTPTNPENYQFIQTIRSKKGQIVTLTKSHKLDQAALVINDNCDGHTLDRNKLYTSGNPAFLWDKWATVNSAVLTVFCRLANCRLTLEQFDRIQTALHLTTASCLGAFKSKVGNSNLLFI
jgi:hypothetical protein